MNKHSSIPEIHTQRARAITQAFREGIPSKGRLALASSLHPFWEDFILNVYECSGAPREERENFSSLSPEKQIDSCVSSPLLNFACFVESFQKTCSDFKLTKCG